MRCERLFCACTCVRWSSVDIPLTFEVIHTGTSTGTISVLSFSLQVFMVLQFYSTFLLVTQHPQCYITLLFYTLRQQENCSHLLIWGQKHQQSFCIYGRYLWIFTCPPKTRSAFIKVCLDPVCSCLGIWGTLVRIWVAQQNNNVQSF